jgi:hypothetical protein
MTHAVPAAARRAGVAAAVGVTLLLTACTPSDGTEELNDLFDEEQTSEDVLPDQVLDDVAVDGETTRRLAADGATTFYAARSNEGASTCLVLVDGGGSGVSSCTMTPNPTGTEVGNGEERAMFVMPGTDFTSLERSGWTRLGDFLAVR